MPHFSRRTLLGMTAAAPFTFGALAQAATPADAKFEALAKGWVDASLRLSRWAPPRSATTASTT
uniref:Uncharacterized protein n=1 Tax=Phenylobacterium glaciei TaxID=2803784 RepID=A0A974S919_9CAUL|nr:hypothetical protein JKL49_07095 [Phenylobacterium glaciei]